GTLRTEGGQQTTGDLASTTVGRRYSPAPWQPCSRPPPVRVACAPAERPRAAAHDSALLTADSGVLRYSPMDSSGTLARWPTGRYSRPYSTWHSSARAR